MSTASNVQNSPAGFVSVARQEGCQQLSFQLGTNNFLHRLTLTKADTTFWSSDLMAAWRRINTHCLALHNDHLLQFVTGWCWQSDATPRYENDSAFHHLSMQIIWIRQCFQTAGAHSGKCICCNFEGYQSSKTSKCMKFTVSSRKHETESFWSSADPPSIDNVIVGINI